MMNKIILKVLMMGGGFVGGVYCCPKFVKAFFEWQECLNDTYSVFLGPWIEEYQRDALIFGVLSIVCIVVFIIGCRISVDHEEKNTK